MWVIVFCILSLVMCLCYLITPNTKMEKKKKQQSVWVGGSKNRKMKSYKNNGEKTEVRGCPSSGFLPPHPPLLFLFEEHNPIKNSFSMPRNIESSSLCYVVVAVVWWISCVWLLRPHEL